MALIKAKPTSPGRRFVVSVKTPGLHKGKPFAGLIEKKSKTGGRNNAGRITTRHIGGGHKQRYRVIDFKRNKDGIDAVVERIEYDPNRSAHIALLKYMDGERRYIIAPKGVAEGAKLRCTVSSLSRARAPNWRARPALPRNLLRVKALMPRYDYVRVKCVKCLPTVVPQSAKSVMVNTACVHWVKPVQPVGVVFVQPCAAWR
jgi:hypothetical protein